MGYACPVCERPQADGEHLANHIAFTAMGGDDEHEAFLDEHVPDWGELDPQGLAEAVVPHATETDHDVVTDVDLDEGGSVPPGNAADHGHRDGQAHGHSRGRGHRRSDANEHPADALDPETAAVLDEARELTAEMYEGRDRPVADEAPDTEDATEDATNEDADDETGTVE